MGRVMVDGRSRCSRTLNRLFLPFGWRRVVAMAEVSVSVALAASTLTSTLTSLLFGLHDVGSRKALPIGMAAV
jgi:hypothetical protein